MTLTYSHTFATLSDDGRYRYTLSRHWETPDAMYAGRAVFVMLNPSTADAETDDPTIRRCVGFARREGCASVDVVNLYAYRATDPVDLDRARRRGVDIIGDPANAEAIQQLTIDAKLIVAAWGGHKLAQRRRGDVTRLLAGRDVVCLGRTKNTGDPKHPLYVAADTAFERYGTPALIT